MPDGPSRPRPARETGALYRKRSATQDSRRNLLGWPIAVPRMPFTVGIGGSVPNEASIRLSGPGVAGGRHGAQPRRGLSCGARSLRGGRPDVVTTSFALDVRGARERSHLDRERPTRAVSSEPGSDSGARGRRRAGVRPTCRIRRGTFSWRVLGIGGGTWGHGRRCRASGEAPRADDAKGCTARGGGDGGTARPRCRGGPSAGGRGGQKGARQDLRG